MSVRMMSVAGSFYPASANEIQEMVNHYNRILTLDSDTLKDLDSFSGNAVIVPHAGWIYSGFTANIAFRLLAHTNPKTIVVIGPSHRVGFEGISISDAESYQTPLGDLSIDTQVVLDLKSRFALPTFAQAHHEHSTEVQMPFIKHYMSNVKVVELVYGYAEPSHIALIIDYILNFPNTAIVISTDLSHYYSLDEAKQLDSLCLKAICHNNIQELHQGCEACGIIGVEAMLRVAKKKGLESILLDYRTSADASGDTDHVVGYASVLFR